MATVFMPYICGFWDHLIGLRFIQDYRLDEYLIWSSCVHSFLGKRFGEITDENCNFQFIVILYRKDFFWPLHNGCHPGGFVFTWGAFVLTTEMGMVCIISLPAASTCSAVTCSWELPGPEKPIFCGSGAAVGSGGSRKVCFKVESCHTAPKTMYN